MSDPDKKNRFRNAKTEKRVLSREQYDKIQEREKQKLQADLDAAREAERTAEKEANNDNANNKDENKASVAFTREELIKEYDFLHKKLCHALEQKAEYMTRISAAGTKRATISQRLEAEKKSLDQDLRRATAVAIGGYLKELKSVQNALEQVISQIEKEPSSDALKSFLDGLSMTGKRLDKIFNQYSDHNASSPIDPDSGAEIPTAQTYEAEKPNAFAFTDDMDSVMINVNVIELEKRLMVAEQENKKLEEKARLGDENLERAEKNMKQDLQRMQDQFEKRKANVIESIAKATLPFADDLSLADKEASRQKDNLGAQFNVVSSGLQSVQQALQNTFQQYGIEKMEVLGQKPDYSRHNVLNQLPSDGKTKAGHVMYVAEEGYVLNGQMLREAKVIIAA